MSFITSPGVIFPPLTAGGVAYGTGSQAKVNTAGILGQYLISGGAGVPTFTNLGTFTTVNCTNLVSSGTLASSFTVTSGTAVPLTITNVGTGNSFVVEDSANPDVSPFVIDNRGDVLIGTTSLRSVGNGFQTATNAQIFCELSSGDLVNITSVLNRNDSNGPIFIFGKSRGTAPAGVTAVQLGDNLGVIRFAGADGTTLDPIGAQISASVDGTPGLNDMPGRLVFSTTADGASSPTERMRIDSVGNVGVGTTPLVNYPLDIAKSLTGAAVMATVAARGTIQSDVTASYRGYYSVVGTAVAAFTLGNLSHFRAEQGTFGAGSAVTNQLGFEANSTLTGATNNYGFFSNIASGTNRFNFYASGTADNYFAGSVGLGSVPIAGFPVNIGYNLTGAVTAVNVRAIPTILSDVTTTATVFKTNPFTQAAAFTLGGLTHYDATQGTIGATSVVTNQYGFAAQSSITGATNNYGFYSNIASAANRYNFYAAGTAPNVFTGDTYVVAKAFTQSSTAIPAGGVQAIGVSSTTTMGVYFGSGAPTVSAAKGSLYLRSDGTTVNDRMYVNTNGSTTWTNVVTAT